MTLGRNIYMSLGETKITIFFFFFFYDPIYPGPEVMKLKQFFAQDSVSGTRTFLRLRHKFWLEQIFCLDTVS